MSSRVEDRISVLRVLVTVMLLAPATLASQRPRTSQSDDPAGCYRFDRPLGQSATGALEQHDSTWSSLRLLPVGAVARPELTSPQWRDLYAARSTWKTVHDTLVIRVFSGLVGWDVVLTARNAAYAGTARYLSDASGVSPITVVVHAKREACASASPPR